MPELRLSMTILDGNGERPSRYGCPNALGPHGNGCDTPEIETRRMDELVVKHLVATVLTDDLLPGGHRQVRQTPPNERYNSNTTSTPCTARPTGWTATERSSSKRWSRGDRVRRSLRTAGQDGRWLACHTGRGPPG